MNKVKVIFEDAQHNYSTSVSAQTTQQDAERYFIGKYFNMGCFPVEKMRKCIAIEYTKKVGGGQSA